MGNCFINCICCEHNCLIFPAPRSRKGWQFQTQIIKSDKNSTSQIKVQLNKFMNQARQQVPFMQISSENSKKKDQIIIYFHGNAQDIFHSVNFVLPIFKATQITILCLQYPTYSCYKTQKEYFISNRIKENSQQFHKYIKQNYMISEEKIYIIGRSIGSGPASYLASKVNCDKLVLISPFDTIRKVSMGLVGCVGFMVKNHFSNQQSILTHKGDLLVIHGMIDQVINIRHGKQLVKTYQTSQKRKATFIQPPRMSHNIFDIDQDIIKPIQQFLTHSVSNEKENEFNV